MKNDPASDMDLELKAIFFEALDKPSREQLDRYLDEACGEDPTARSHIENLLRAHHGAGNFLGGASPDSATGDDQPAEGPGTVVGPYKLLERIGEGGFGAVYRAEQQEPLRRQVALKIIKPGMDTREVIARFEAERQALALMDHPGIARVLDAGTTGRKDEGEGRKDEKGDAPHTDSSLIPHRTSFPDAGRPYFVMELIKGVPITEYCDQCNLTTRERLELFVSVCQAVQHAHQKGIIHRDVKPTNVLIAMPDGRPAVKVIDFGVAKAINQRLTEQTLLTGFMQMVGTPLYMSPEQAEMGPLDVDTRSDIYSLGVLLYELLTGTTPFEQDRLKEASYDELRRIIREEEPPRPSTRLSTLKAGALSTIAEHRRTDSRPLSQQVRGDLDWIVMRALEKDRTRRYETANGLARDVERYLNEEPVDACPPSAVYRLNKFLRRNQVAVATASIVGALLLVATGVSTWQAIRATRAEALSRTRLLAETNAHDAADDAREQAEEDKDVAQRRLFDARLAQARAGRRSGQAGQRHESLEALQQAAQLAQELKFDESALREVRNEAIASLSLPDVRLVRDWEMSDPAGKGFTFDSKLEHYTTINAEGQVIVRQSIDDAEMARLTPPENVTYHTAWSAGFSPGGDLLMTYYPQAGPAVLHVWNWRNEAIVFRAPFSDIVREATCYSPDDRRLAIAQSNGDVAVFDVSTGQEMARLETKILPHTLAFSPDGGKLAVSSYHGRQVQIWDVAADKLLHKFIEPSGAWDVAWQPGGRLLAVSNNDFHIRLWDTESGRQHAVLSGHQAAPLGLQFDPSGEVLFSWAWDGTVRLWHAISGQQSFQLAGTIGRLSQDGRGLVCQHGPRLGHWEVARAEVYRTLPTQTDSVSIPLRNLNLGTINPDGRWLVVAGKRIDVGGVGIYDLWRGRPAAHLTLQGTESVLFHPSGEKLFTAGTRGLYRWPFRIDGETLRIGPPTKLATGLKGPMATDPGARLLAYADYNTGAAEILELAQPEKPVGRLAHPLCAFVAVSPDARWIATGTWNGRGVKIWDAVSGKLIKTLIPEAGTSNVYFSPGGRWLVTSTTHDAIRFWEVDSWQASREVSPLSTIVSSRVAWARDGNVLAYTPTRYQVELRDAVTDQPLATLEAPDGKQVHHLDFTPDGSQLVVFSEKPTHVRVWDLRLLREQLAGMGLDWNVPPFPQAEVNHEHAAPLRVEVEYGDLSKDD